MCVLGLTDEIFVEVAGLLPGSSLRGLIGLTVLVGLSLWASAPPLILAWNVVICPKVLQPF